MYYKKLTQIIVLLAMLVSALGFAGSASAYSCGTSYTVQSGDTLGSIALACGTSVAALTLATCISVMAFRQSFCKQRYSSHPARHSARRNPHVTPERRHRYSMQCRATQPAAVSIFGSGVSDFQTGGSANAKVMSGHERAAPHRLPPAIGQ